MMYVARLSVHKNHECIVFKSGRGKSLIKCLDCGEWFIGITRCLRKKGKSNEVVTDEIKPWAPLEKRVEPVAGDTGKIISSGCGENLMGVKDPPAPAGD